MDTKKYYNIAAIISVIVVLVCIWFWGYTVGSNKPAQIITNDSIITKDSIIIDSIYLDNAIIETKIRYIEKDFKEQVPAILSNSDSANLIFFTNYIDSYNKQRSVENN